MGFEFDIDIYRLALEEIARIVNQRNEENDNEETDSNSRDCCRHTYGEG